MPSNFFSRIPICGILLLFVIQVSSFAQTNIAVIDLASRGSLQPSEVRTLTDRLRSSLVQTEAFTVLDRSQMETILEEQGFQLSGCTSTECAVEAGKILGVQDIVTGSIGRVGKLFTVDILLVDVETSQIKSSLTRDHYGQTEGLVNLMGILAQELAQSVSALTSQTSKMARLSISSEPVNAVVFLNGQQRGKTPITLDQISAGTHRIALEKEGFQSFTETISVHSGQTLSYHRDLNPLIVVTIQSDPAEAEVEIDEKFIGHTPLKTNIAKNSKINIVIQKKGFNVWQDTLRITNNQTIQAELKSLASDDYTPSDQAGKALLEKKSSSGKRWWLISGGALISGAAVYILWLSQQDNNNDETGSFPDPPVRP
ncbi:MAG: PEGA domain-containing protein [Caldithrix sp.]|nr:PEGA domain-containing protein [Caldithrix sp.]